MNNDFLDLRDKLRLAFPELRIHHGGDELPNKPRVEMPPVVKLANYVERHNIRLTDLFQTADPDRRLRVSRSQFVDGIKVQPSHV